MCPYRALLAGALVASQLCGRTWAQTLIVSGTETDANENTVALAADTVSGDLFEEEALQLTDAVLANLTDLSLTNVSLLYFNDEDKTMQSSGLHRRCKAFPGHASWPSRLMWRVLDLVTGGALIETVPLSAACYNDFGVYDGARCDEVTSSFANSSLHIGDPTSSMWPIYQGLTCQPTDDPTDECTLGGFPSYVINASNVAQIQLGVNFARALDMRLVVKNTGHDFCGRSLGAGALSIWTNQFKGIKFYKNVRTSSYSGPAMKVGAGVLGVELFEAAEKYGVTAVGGEGLSVGYAGGYLAGGGHSPMSSMYGMAADSILSIDVVTPDGRFITANEKKDKDLFWAMSGGGGSTFGVAISYTVKVYPKTKAAVMSFSFTTGESLSYDAFWEAFREYLKLVPSYNDVGNYQYWNLIHVDEETLGFIMSPWFAPGFSLEELKELTAPLFATWAELGIEIKPQASEHDSYYPAWAAGFPRELVGGTATKVAGRLFPRENFEDTEKFNRTFEALKGLSDRGGNMLAFSVSNGPEPHPNNAVNPAWRTSALFAVSVIAWPPGSSQQVMAEESRKLTEWMQLWRDAAPNSGTYASESDVTEPDFKRSFYGDKYDRLLQIKDAIDPTGLFYANEAVGSDRWYVSGQLPGFPTQNGRLCHAGTGHN